MNKLIAISEAAKLSGISLTTLRRWEASGKLVSERTRGGRRRYRLSSIRPDLARGEQAPKKTIAYARVSSHDQKQDLERQTQLLELYCAHQGWSYSIISDLGRAMNYNKMGLRTLLDEIISGKAVGSLCLKTERIRLLWMLQRGRLLRLKLKVAKESILSSESVWRHRSAGLALGKPRCC